MRVVVKFTLEVPAGVVSRKALLSALFTDMQHFFDVTDDEQLSEVKLISATSGSVEGIYLGGGDKSE